ncbi:MAG: phosphoglycerate kinase [Alkalispirochaeta sp.]
MKITSMKEVELHRKKVLLRLDINSPIDPKTKKIVSDNRIRKSLPTLEYLLEQEAAIAIIAHQGDTLDYQNLIPLAEQAERLTELLGREVRYIDDVCGPAAVEAVKALQPGELIILGNLRYLTEEVSSFENNVPLTAPEMTGTWLVRSLAPLFDLYINDAFAAAHRNAPSMVAFQEVLPSAAGTLFFDEVSALTTVMEEPPRPAVFLLGGAKISDAFGMMEQVLSNGSADTILTVGVTGLVFLLADGYSLGSRVDEFLKKRSLDAFIEPARTYLADYPGRIRYPLDLAYEKPDGSRAEVGIDGDLPDGLFPDIGSRTIATYKEVIATAGTIFVNGPAGVFEEAKWEIGTRELWRAIADAPGYSVVGGGDSVSATSRFTDPKKMSYICTAGGAMVRFLSGKKLPLIAAMETAWEHRTKGTGPYA